MKSFMLCADDYGMTKGVSKAILNLADRQQLSAVGCMTNFKHWPELAKEIAPLANKIDIGIHLNLTLGTALDNEAKPFSPASVMVRRSLFRQIDSAGIEREINAQCMAFEDHMQCRPDFIDGHQHVHALPVIRQALMKVMNHRYGACKPWLRDPSDNLSSILARKVAVSKALTVKGLAYGFGNLANAAGIKTNQGFSGFSAFDDAQDFGADFEQFLVGMAEKHLIMCHPGFVDDELRGLDPVVETRKKEYDFLFDGRFEDMCEQKKVILSRFG